MEGSFIILVMSDPIRSYYDQNTSIFLKFSSSRKAQNIHRSLWTDGARTLEDALNVANNRILNEIVSVTPEHARILDLGCGVGASLFHIYPRLQNPSCAVGLTISSLQAKHAFNSARQMNLHERIRFAQGDFTAIPLQGPWDVAYSIEAVFHAVNPEKYFLEVSRVLRRGGKLVLIDDFQAQRSFSREDANWLMAFKDGWHLPGLSTVEEVKQWAGKYELSLIKDEFLTPYLRLRNLPDGLARTIRFLGNQLPIRHPILPSMLGSMALQQCLHEGIVEYRFLVFEKV